MTKTRVSACAFVVAASLAGCMGTSDVEYAGEVRVTSPDLVEISPGVMVIADADEPLFYSRGNYWLYRDGYWFRSTTYRSGFARVEYTYVPNEIRVIDRPQLYVHYRSNAARTRHARQPQPQQRRSQPAQPTVQQPQPQPTYPQQPITPSATQPTTPSATPPALPSHPTHPNATGTPPGHIPHQPGATPAQPTLPPAATDPVQTPSDHRREPPAQREAPPSIDHTAPRKDTPQQRKDVSAPGQANRPQDRGPSAAPAPQGPSTPGATNRPDDRGNNNNGNSGNAPGQRKDVSNTGSPSAPKTNESVPPQDRADRATPPGQTKTDDRTKKEERAKKEDQKKDKKKSDY